MARPPWSQAPHRSDKTAHRNVRPSHFGGLRCRTDQPMSRRHPMTDFQAIADRVEIEALRGEFTDAAMMRDRARLAALFTPRRRAADAEHPRRAGRPGGDPRRGRAAAGPVGLLRAEHPPGHDPARRRHRAGRAYIQELARSATAARDRTSPSTTTATGAPPTAGSSPSGSTRSGTSTPARWPAQRPLTRSPRRPQKRPLTRRSSTRRPSRGWSGRRRRCGRTIRRRDPR